MFIDAALYISKEKTNINHLYIFNIEISITYTAFANANTIPTDAPNSGPNERDMIKYIPPPFTSPFVLIADKDNVVMTHTNADIAIMTNV